MTDGHINSRISNLEKTVARIERKLNHLEIVVSTPRQEHVDAVGKQDHNHDEQGETESSPTISPQGKPNTVKTKSPNEKWYNSFQWWASHPFEWWKHRLEIVALAAGVGYALVTYFEWRDLQHNFEKQLRAYLGLNGVGLICPDCAPNAALPGNSSDLVIIHVKNFGQTPAYNATYTVNFQMEPPHQVLPEDFSYADKPLALPSNSINGKPHFLIGVGGEDAALNYPVTEEFRADVLKSRYSGNSLFVYGHIDYETIFQKKCSVTYVLFFDHTTQPESFGHFGNHDGIDTCE